MNKRNLSLLLLLLTLLGTILYLSRDWFARAEIQIGYTIRPNRLSERQQRRFGPAVQDQPYTLTFFFDKRYALESVKVVRVREIETNRFAHPLWELVSDSNSVPVKTLTYGVSVRGLHPKVRGAQADALQQDVPYRLLLETGGREASYDFTLGKR